MALKEDVTILAALPVFRPFPEEALRLLAFSSESRILRSGDLLIRAGVPSDGAYLVRTGRIRIIRQDVPGDLMVESGTLIGESGLIIDNEFRFTAMAVEASSVLHIPRASVRKVLQEFPSAAEELRRDILERLQDIGSRIARISEKLG
jgi:CRP-like cAMP-binding protein